RRPPPEFLLAARSLPLRLSRVELAFRSWPRVDENSAAAIFDESDEGGVGHALVKHCFDNDLKCVQVPLDGLGACCDVEIRQVMAQFSRQARHAFQHSPLAVPKAGASELPNQTPTPCKHFRPPIPQPKDPCARKVWHSRTGFAPASSG